MSILRADHGGHVKICSCRVSAGKIHVLCAFVFSPLGGLVARPQSVHGMCLIVPTQAPVVVALIYGKSVDAMYGRRI